MIDPRCWFGESYVPWPCTACPPYYCRPSSTVFVNTEHRYQYLPRVVPFLALGRLYRISLEPSPLGVRQLRILIDASPVAKEEA